MWSKVFCSGFTLMRSKEFRFRVHFDVVEGFVSGIYLDVIEGFRVYFDVVEGV